MKDLEFYGNRCIQELNAIGIFPNKISEWKINTRCHSRWGLTTKVNGYYKIEIASCLLEDNCPEKALRETLFHELLHCVNGCMNHKILWKKYADIVSDCYSVNISISNTSKEKFGNSEYYNEYNENIKSLKKTFMCECIDCGEIYKRTQQRAPKWYVHPNNFRCSACKGKLKKVEISA